MIFQEGAKIQISSVAEGEVLCDFLLVWNWGVF